MPSGSMTQQRISFKEIQLCLNPELLPWRVVVLKLPLASLCSSFSRNSSCAPLSWPGMWTTAFPVAGCLKKANQNYLEVHNEGIPNRDRNYCCCDVHHIISFKREGRCRGQEDTCHVRPARRSTRHGIGGRNIRLPPGQQHRSKRGPDIRQG